LKNAFIGFLLFVFVSGYGQSTESWGVERIAESEMKAQRQLVGPAQAGFANDYNLVYHRCQWTLDPAINFIAGSVTTYFKPLISSFATLHFDLSDSLVTDSVLYHGSALSFVHGKGNNNLLTIQFAGTLAPNILDSVVVYYHGIPPPSGFGSFYQGSHKGAPVIWTLSEPYGARDWWPCKQNLLDKIDSLDVLVTVPAANRVAGNGVLLSEVLNGNTKTVHWKTRYPIAAYLVAVAVTNYVQYSHYLKLPTGDSLEVLNYVYPEDLALAKSSTPQILKTMALYDSLTITYPFYKEKYGHAEFGWGGGMEHQTMSFVSGFSNTLISHECAHQWFGDRITLGSWQDIWLNEGFATYFEALTEERYFPGNWMTWKKNTILDAAKEPHGSVLCDDTTRVWRIFSGSLSYSKGAYVLHMLRWKLGDVLFFKALQNYLNDPQLAYKYARTPDLVKHLEQTSGQNLTTFFRQWYYKRGLPSYQIEWKQQGPAVQLTIGQTQSDTSVSFFEMPVPIRFTGGGRDTTVVFNHTYSGQVFSLNLNFRVDFLSFDPDLHLLSVNNVVRETKGPQTLAESFAVYPNPGSGLIQILNNDAANPVQFIELFDVPGNFVQRYDMRGALSLMQIDLSLLAAGTYELRINTDKGVVVKKLEIK
jgi:aminopeptidase N